MGGKMLIVSFEEDEEEIFDKVLKVLQENEMIQFQHKCRNKNEIRYINLLIDIGQRIVKKCNQETELTYKEFEILHLLAAHPGQVFSKEQIYDIVWNEPYSGDYNIVMTHIHHIRTKLEDDPTHPFYIQTVWGVGYRFNKNASSEL